MEHLKTLKDFEFNKLGINYIPNSDDLKQEAIKHIKNAEQIKNTTHIKEVALWNEAQIRWIKYFFNITDEELK